MKLNKLNVFSTAWRLVNTIRICFADALRKAWALVKIQALQTAMSTGVVTITFRKLSGELTTRQATRSLDLIPSEHHPKNGSRAYKSDLFLLPFYSLTDGGH